MPYYNKTSIIGHLGKDAETRTITEKFTVTSFTVATSRYWKDSKGEKQSKTTWHNIKASNLPSWMNELLKKGKTVFVDGAYESDEYEKDGQKRTIYYIKAETVLMLDKTERNEVPNYPVDKKADDDGLPF